MIDFEEKNIKMKIYIVRHGQTNHNVKKIYSNEDEDLNLNGINQANKLKEQKIKRKKGYRNCKGLYR